MSGVESPEREDFDDCKAGVELGWEAGGCARGYDTSSRMMAAM